jgi:phenylacetate-CoA ligase
MSTAVAVADMRDPEIETMPRDALERLQGERLRRQVEHVDAHSDFFRSLFAANRVRPSDVNGLDDLFRLPRFAKEDLRNWRESTGDPFAGTLCVPAERLTFVTHSSGTSGRPNFFGLTLDEYEEVWKIYARTFQTVGIRPGDHAVLSGRNLWHAAAHGFDKAFERMGVVKYYFGTPQQDVIPHLFESAPDLLSLLNITISLQPEVEVEYIRSHEIDPRVQCPNLRILQTGVEMSSARRRLLADTWGVPVRNQFGSGDQFWMCGECPADERWTHAPEDYLVFEVLDPHTHEPVPSGGTGVLHVTNLWMESFPFIRYDMEDMVAHDTSPCPCGRTSKRLAMRGRLAWSVRVGDRYVFSQDVEEVLWARPELTAPNYQLVRRSQQPQDALEVRLAAPGGAVSPALRDELARELSRQLDLPCHLTLVEHGTISVKGWKAERVVNE